MSNPQLENVEMARGFKSGGRRKGTPNRSTSMRKKLAEQGISFALSEGISPLELLLVAMRGGPDAEAITEMQIRCATTAAPYVRGKPAPEYGSLSKFGGRTHEERLDWLGADPDDIPDAQVQWLPPPKPGAD